MLDKLSSLKAQLTKLLSLEETGITAPRSLMISVPGGPGVPGDTVPQPVELELWLEGRTRYNG